MAGRKGRKECFPPIVTYFSYFIIFYSYVKQGAQLENPDNRVYKIHGIQVCILLSVEEVKKIGPLKQALCIVFIYQMKGGSHMCISSFFFRKIICFVLLSSLLIIFFGHVAIAGNVIYVPYDSGRNYWRGAYQFSKSISVIDRSGVKHELKNASVIDTLDSDEAGKMGFSKSEANRVFELTTPEGYKDRKTLENSGASCFKMYVPISEIRRIKFLPKKKAYMFYPINSKIEPFMAKFEYGGRPRYIQGTEDLGEFGKASFKESIDSLKGIVLPDIPLEGIASKSNSSAIVTEIGGIKHELRDLRISTFFYKGESNFKIDADKIDTIVVTEESNRGRVKCIVKLKSGAEQNFEWSFGYVGGKEGPWYKRIRAEHIASVQISR